jgi:hypothetical protein
MPNPHKGEVAFEAEGKTYTLRFSIDALCNLEEAAGKGFASIAIELSDPEKMSVSLLRKVLWAGLIEHHPDLDVRAAGELILAAGGAVVVLGQIEKAFTAAFPEDPEKGARPQTPGRPNGTGPASTEAGQVSAATKKPSGDARPAKSA